MNKTILAMDLGFGYNKVVIARGSEILHKFKFPSVAGVVQRNTMIQDPRIFTYGETDSNTNDFYVGEDARKLQTDKIIDIKDYDSLQFFGPLFIYYVIKTTGIKPDILATGLSKAHIAHSGKFEEKLKKFVVNGETITFENVWVLPQGAGAKIAIDKYGDQFPTPNKEFLGNATYVGSDIGLAIA